MHKAVLWGGSSEMGHDLIMCSYCSHHLFINPSCPLRSGDRLVEGVLTLLHPNIASTFPSLLQCNFTYGQTERTETLQVCSMGIHLWSRWASLSCLNLTELHFAWAGYCLCHSANFILADSLSHCRRTLLFRTFAMILDLYDRDVLLKRIVWRFTRWAIRRIQHCPVLGLLQQLS